MLEAPRAEPSISLSQLPDKLKEKGLDLSTDPESCLESYLGYTAKPNEDPDADWRLDVMAGSTCCVPFINGYLNGDNDFMDELHADGAAAGFLCYPLDRQQLTIRGNNQQVPMCLIALTITRDDVKDYLKHSPEFKRANRFKEFEMRIYI